MKFYERMLVCVLAVILLLNSIFAIQMSVAAAPQTKSSSDNYEYQGKWIWSESAKKAGQWVCLRKTFTLKTVPTSVMARIAVDSKYWMWINGEMVIFEGQVKTGPNRTDMYYDHEDIAQYLKTGVNTIAIQAVYFGKNGYSIKDTGEPGFLFDADFGVGALENGTRIVSDASWKACVDPAYKEPDADRIPNYRLAEPSIKYDANSELSGWVTAAYDDSQWPSAAEKGEVGDSPWNALQERPIPQLKVEELERYTADGSEGTKTWTKEPSTGIFVPLILPEEYVVTVEFTVQPLLVSGFAPVTNTGSMGLAVNMQDADHFYMPQVSMADLATRKDSASYKPHIRDGNWSTPLDGDMQDISSIIPDGERFSTKHTMVVSVDTGGFSATVDGEDVARVDSAKYVEGGGIGFRNDEHEQVRIYSLKATSKDGATVYFESDMQEGSGRPSWINTLSGSDPEIREDENGENYLYLTNTICMVGDMKAPSSRYTIRNRTNIQGTPYLKVKAEAGQPIDIWTDAWYDINGNCVRHMYLTRDGEQEWEPLGWMNGYDVYFDIPDAVEVLELGFRPSTYNTEPAGSFVSDDEELNILYQKAYDTLLVTMRDNYMDCPTRERAQWWGDAVNEMQMAFYAMDSNAGLLYKKTLNQMLGWKNEAGQLPTTAPNGIDAISELPMQALAGVHSFWQYYMYSGDVQPLEDGYDDLLRYLKLWTVDDGLVQHRGGTWDWMDWGSHADGTIIEQCWYYVAAQAVKNIAVLLEKPEADITFLDERMQGIADKFESAFWKEDKQAYYNATDNNVADDRANALAVYSGLAQETRYEDIKNVLVKVENSSPYMEKYVLEALYMMGFDDEAMARTRKRYSNMVDDEYPTLWEFWDKTAGTPNHAWAGGPLSMMYMFNAGITPLTASYETFQVRPLLAGLTSVEASAPTPGGTIDVKISEKQKNGSVTLAVTVPSGSREADIYVPCQGDAETLVRLNDVVIYENGAATEQLPADVSCKGEEEGFVVFTVPSGSYTFMSTEKNRTLTVARVDAEIAESQIYWDETTEMEVQVYDADDFAIDMTQVELQYQSVDTSVATVDAEGVVYAKNTGTTNIRVTAVYGESRGSVSVPVTVEEPQVLPPVITEVTETSITLRAVSGYEYILDTPQGEIVSSNPQFTGLTAGVSYGIYQRIAKTDNHGAGSYSARVEVTTGKSSYIPVEKITLSETSIQVETGTMVLLEAEVTPADTTNPELFWSSSNPSVASVDEFGRVEAKAAGEANVTATASSGVSAVCRFKVLERTGETPDPGQSGGQLQPGDQNQPETPAVSIKKVKLNVTKATLGVKETYKLKASVTPVGASVGKLTWSSSNSKVAAVNASGKVTAKKTGTATIRVKTSNGKTASCKITVKKAPKSLKLNATKKVLKVGKTFSLKATRSKGSAGSITYTSSNKKVATVSAAGKIKAVKKGKAVITAKTYNGKKAKITITVKK